jgi:hypothetical protein
MEIREVFWGKRRDAETRRAQRSVDQGRRAGLPALRPTGRTGCAPFRLARKAPASACPVRRHLGPSGSLSRDLSLRSSLQNAGEFRERSARRGDQGGSRWIKVDQGGSRWWEVRRCRMRLPAHPKGTSHHHVRCGTGGLNRRLGGSETRATRTCRGAAALPLAPRGGVFGGTVRCRTGGETTGETPALPIPWPGARDECPGYRHFIAPRWLCWSHVQSHPLIEAWGEAELWGYRLLPSEEAPA